MKFSWVTVTVKDMDESIRFYTDIRFQHKIATTLRLYNIKKEAT